MAERKGHRLWWPYLGDGAIILALSLWVGHPYLQAGNAMLVNSTPGGFGDPYFFLGSALTGLKLIGQGVIPLGTVWIPSIWAGLPGAIGVFGLPSLVVWLMMGATPLTGVYAAYNIVLFLSILVGAASAYYLGYVVTAQRSAAIVAAVAYAYSPYVYGLLFESTSHIDLTMGVALLPLMLAFWEKLIRRPTGGNAVWASLGTVLVFVSYPQPGLYGAIYVAFRLIFQAVLLSRRGLAPLLRLGAVSGAAGAMTLSFLLPLHLPALLFRSASYPYPTAAAASLNISPLSLNEMVVAGAVLALGIIAFKLVRRHRFAATDMAIVSLMLATAYFFLLAQGAFAPLPVLKLSFDYIPLMQTIRAVGRAFNVAVLGVSVVAGYGWAHLMEGLARRLGPRGSTLGAPLGWIVAALVIGQYWFMIQGGRGLPVYTYRSFQKTIPLESPFIARLSSDAQPSRVLSLPAKTASPVIGAVVKPDMTSTGPPDYTSNYRLFYESKMDLADSFEKGRPGLAHRAAFFGIKYVLLNTGAPTRWGGGPLGGSHSSWGTLEIDPDDKKEGQASLRARWQSGAAGWAAIAYSLPSAQDWRGADGLKLWVKFSQGGWGGYVVGLQDAARIVAWQRFDYSSVDQWQEVSFPLPFAPAPESFQWNKAVAVVIGATDPSKPFTPLTIQVDGIRLAGQSSTTQVDTSTEAMFALAYHLQSLPEEFRLIGFEDGWFTFENLGFRGMAFELCPPGQPCDPVAIDYQRPDANTIRLSFDLARKARLLVSETYHQGWVADDPRVKVGNENGLLLLEVSEPGSYRITLRYQPYDQFLPWVGLGWGGWALAVVGLMLPWRRIRGRFPRAKSGFTSS